MKNKLILAMVIGMMTITSFSQSIFIGKTKNQVLEYWKLNVPHNSISTEPNAWYNNIVRVETPKISFEAIFDENNKCYHHELRINSEEVSMYEFRLQKNGFALDKKSNIYKKGNISAEIQYGLSSDRGYVNVVFDIISTPVRTQKEINQDNINFNKIKIFIGKNLIGFKVIRNYKKFIFSSYEFDDLVPIYTIYNSRDTILIKDETSIGEQNFGSTTYVGMFQCLANDDFFNSDMLDDILNWILEHKERYIKHEKD